MPGLQKQSLIQERLTRFNQEAEERDAQRRAVKLNQPYLNLITTPVEIDALKLIPKETAEKLKIAAINIVNQNLVVAVFNSQTPGISEEIEKLKKMGYQPKVFIASLGGLKHAWSYYQYVTEAAKEITEMVNIENLEKLSGELKTTKAIQQKLAGIDFNKASISEIFEIILASALTAKVSDIHFEPRLQKTAIRFRLDGILQNVFDILPEDIHSRLVSRIKLLSRLKINIHDAPQDGRFTIKTPKKEIEVRVAIAPSEFGETVVMRLLDPETISLTLQDIGLLDEDLKIIEEQLKNPNGLILNTGPTGSGKTTTLYAFLKKVYNPEIKVITIEDPIEYHLEGIEQTQVDKSAGYTFANGLRSILRQDPDVLLVGEIRDLETADIAMNASLTGHLVFSTLHTNSAAGAIPRLIDLGIKPKTIGPALNLIIAQRLLRRLCQHCRRPKNITPELKAKIEKFLAGLPARINRERFKDIKIFEAVGCEKCNLTGYKGRVAIFELLALSEKLKELIHQDVSEGALKKAAGQEGMLEMQQDGVLKVLTGMTSFRELERMTGTLRI